MNGVIQPARVEAIYTKFKPLLRGHLVQGLVRCCHVFLLGVSEIKLMCYLKSHF